MIPSALGIMRKTFGQGNSIFQNALISCFPCDTQWVPLGIIWKEKEKENQFWHCVKPLNQGYYWNWCGHSFPKMPHGFLDFIKHYSKIHYKSCWIIFMDGLMILASMGHWGSAQVFWSVRESPKTVSKEIPIGGEKCGIGLISILSSVSLVSNYIWILVDPLKFFLIIQ
jgi:hypothetical protein